MKKNRSVTSLLATLLVLLAAALPARAQTTLPLDRELRVYLDCTDFYCEEDFFIEEIPWVDFVRDRQVADVHVQGTTESTGSGGTEYTLEFIGRDAFAGRSSRLVHVDPPDATEGTTRTGLVRAVRIGLAPFAMATASGGGLDIALAAAQEGDEETPAAPVDDPWNRWVFRTSINSYVNGESQQNFFNMYYSVSASRVTEAWKHSISGSGSYDRSYFEFEQLDSLGNVEFADTFISGQRSYGVHLLNVKSLTDHWSVGARTAWNRSDFLNQQSRVRVNPAIEYSVFPYEESTRRQFTFTYMIGPAYIDYTERTIFDRTHEALLQQQLIGSYDVTQPWGSIDLTVGASHYIMQLDEGEDWPDPQYSVSSYVQFDVRIFQGLSLNAWGGVDWLRDQIYLPAGGQSEREILLRRQQLATNYQYYGQIGLSYTFGSIFSPVVNPRLGEL